MAQDRATHTTDRLKASRPGQAATKVVRAVRARRDAPLLEGVRQGGSKAGRHYRAGLSLHRSKDWAGAADAFRQAIAADPSRPKPYYRLGRALEKQKRWGGAAAAYREATLRDDGEPEWFFRLGSALERSGDWHGASQAYREFNALGRRLPARERASLPSLDLAKQIDLALVPRPAYAYCIHKASQLAAALGIERISVLEFGVAGGNGLIVMEKHAAQMGDLTGVKIDVLGFDTGEGLLEPADYRDLPYFFNKGSYAMDVEALTKRLTRAELVLGDAPVTFQEVAARQDLPPIGAVSFDMDYYSPTRDVLAMMGQDAPPGSFLPRVPMYFDDVVGERGQDYNEFTGELLAIDEFNASNASVKLTEDRHFRALPLNLSWHHCIYTMHRFNHPHYDTYIRPRKNVHMRLR